MNYKIRILALLLLISVGVVSCRKEPTKPQEETKEGIEVATLKRVDDTFQGFYLLNEGAFQSNKSSLDYANFLTGRYIHNVFGLRNPNKVKELGDTGNDLKIYGSKLYIVVNGSHKVEILDAYTARHIAQIDIPSGRYINFHKQYAYVSSYANPQGSDANAPGVVYRIDTASLQMRGIVEVGYQPEEMEVINDFLYVVNSGGYRAPNYDKTISVIDLNSFVKQKDFTVALNMHRMRKDAHNALWISSRGNYKDVPSNLHCVRYDAVSQASPHVEDLNIPVNNMAIDKDYLYFTSSLFDNTTKKQENRFGIVKISTRKLFKENFISDGTEQKIKSPYGLAIHPTTGEIFIMDAGDFTSSGTLFIYTKEGVLKAQIPTGDIPNGIVFLPKR